MDVNTLKAESQIFNLLVIVSFLIQRVGVEREQWKMCHRLYTYGLHCT